MLQKFSKTINISLIFFILLNSVALSSGQIKQNSQNVQTNTQPDYAPLIEELKVKIPELMAQRKTPGLAVAFVDGEKLVWAEGFGFTDNSQKTKVSADTLFSIQSISKTYTATGFLIAATKGKLKLDDKLKKYLPNFSIKSRFGADEADKITFRHLLSHWAGLPIEAPSGNNFDECACTLEQHIKSISDSWLIAPVGERYSYSNLGIDLTGYVLGLRSKKTFEQFMKDELFTPLGMNSSTFSQKEALQTPSFAKGHIRDRELPDIYIPMIPSGSMYSSVKDMARFLSFQLAGGKVNGKRLISEKLLTEMYQPQFAVPGQVAGYGLGINTQPWSGGTFLTHAGGGYGYSTQQYWMPEYGIGVVVLTNAQSGSLSSDIADRVMLKMIEAKKGSVPPNKPSDFSDKPIVNPEPNLLRRLDGTYKSRFNLVTFKFEEDGLFHISGNNKTKLNAISPTEFIFGNRKLTFYVDANGRPTGVFVLSQSEAEFMPFNDSPNDQPGANKPEWQSFVGDYQGQSYGNPVTTKVFLKNGYLYVSWGSGLKLTEYQPGLFFTAEGEAVSFQGDRLSLGNRPFVKSKS